ncbi:MAG: hypothetical protein Q9182_001383 [Xanthomendoza sp. 2 TL-2023]
MTRTKAPSKHPKRHELTDPSGWTHIIRGLKTIHLSKPSLPTDPLQPSQVPQSQTLTHLQASHAKYREQWLSSPCYQHIRRLFTEEVLSSLDPGNGKEKTGRIDRCIVLGLGSLSNGRRSSWWELVFLETILSLLPSSSSSPSTPSANPSTSPDPTPQDPPSPRIKNHETPTTHPPTIDLLIQDPIFNPLDHEFLASLGYTILTHPSAFTQITSSTLLFAPHLEIDIYAQALSGAAQPALCIGTDLTECLDRLSTAGGRDKEKADEDERRGQSRAFQEYLDATLSKRLPEFERDDWMYFTNVIWRKPVDDREKGKER